jgi:hypothetical protein
VTGQLTPLGVSGGSHGKWSAASKMNQAQNVTMRGAQMARNAAVVFVFRESPFDITSYRASKKIRTQIVMMLPTKISLSAIADEVLDERLLTLELLEGSVAISDITRTTRGCQYKRFSRGPLRGSHRALYCYFETYCSQHHMILAGN